MQTRFLVDKSQAFLSNHIIDQYCSKETTRVTLRQLTVFGRSLNAQKLIKSANYVRCELPVRLAHRIRDFQNLPFIVGTNPHIHKVYELYWNAFEKFRQMSEIKTLEDNDRFCRETKEMLKRHVIAIPQIAIGMSETSNHLEFGEADRFMNELLRSRIGRRVLAEQHISLTESYKTSSDRSPRKSQQRTHNNDEDHMIGMVHTKCHVASLALKCQDLLNKLFKTSYTIKPSDIIIDGQDDVTFAYIPAHLEYILFELLKNSMYYTLKKHTPQLLEGNVSMQPNLGNASPKQPKLPPIHLTISQDHEEGIVMFRISDQGGGVPPDVLKNIWSFSHVNKLSLLKNFKHMPELVAKIDDLVPPTMHLGLGLSMSRAFANYWGGTIQVYSMSGYGTDVYVKIHTGNQKEHLKYDRDRD